MIIYLVGGILALGAILWSKNTMANKKLNVDAWTRFDDLFKKYALQYKVDWTWLKAIALNESDLGREKSVKHGLENPFDIEKSKSSDGKSWGLMQVTLTTARDLDPSASEVKLNNPEYSVKLAAQYLSWLLGRFAKSDLRYQEWVIKSYNQGTGNTMKEKNGTSKGFAHEYWERFQRNLKKVKESV